MSVNDSESRRPLQVDAQVKCRSTSTRIFRVSPGVELIQLSRNESSPSRCNRRMDGSRSRSGKLCRCVSGLECSLLRQAIAEIFCLDDRKSFAAPV